VTPTPVPEPIIEDLDEADDKATDADLADLSPEELLEMDIDPDADGDANIEDTGSDNDMDADADGDDDPEYGVGAVRAGLRMMSLSPQQRQGQGQDFGRGFMGLGWSVQAGEGESIGTAIFDPIQCIRQQYALQDQHDTLIPPQHSWYNQAQPSLDIPTAMSFNTLPGFDMNFSNLNQNFDVNTLTIPSHPQSDGSLPLYSTPLHDSSAPRQAQLTQAKNVRKIQNHRSSKRMSDAPTRSSNRSNKGRVAERLTYDQNFRQVK
jgi:hypothetical protein